MKSQDTYLWVLAGDRQQAEHLAQVFLIPRAYVKYISDSQQLRGVEGKGKVLWIYGTATQRTDFDECVRLAEIRGFSVKSVHRGKSPLWK